jgi:general secretion pathway protein F/type IV pilus assembly protein PilC
LAESGLLDDDVVEIISVGESANNLDEVLLKVGDSIETRLDRMLGSAVRLIEPLLLLVMAGVVGTVAAALLLPMSKLSSSL